MWHLYNEDCLVGMRRLPENSIDAIVTDPPAGIGMLSHDWDSDKGGRDEWVSWLTEIMREALRVLKPGGYAVVWALPRTSHWTGWALENAGFEVCDSLHHVFGTGFPKSYNVSKALAKQGLVEAAKQWEGFGTALKPGHEVWWLCQKPLSEKTIVANLLRWGVGALNIDAARVRRKPGDRFDYGRGHDLPHANTTNSLGKFAKVTAYECHEGGRWPSNFLLSHHPGCVLKGTKKVKANREGAGKLWSHYQDSKLEKAQARPSHLADADGMETVETWECVDGCPVKALDEMSGPREGCKPHRLKSTVEGYSFGFGSITNRTGEMVGYNDEGGASRFFPTFPGEPFNYFPKANKKDRGEGNIHPTCKSQALMRWFLGLVCPPGGRVLDPFAGSGTTLLVAEQLGLDAVGFEQDAEYFRIATGRLSKQDRSAVS